MTLLDHPTPRLSRRLAKFAYFAVRGVSRATAWWLASRDAVKRNDYRGVSIDCLESAYRADPRWQDIEAKDGEVRSRTLELPFVSNDLTAADYATACGLRRRGFIFAREPSATVAANETWSLRFTTTEHLSMAREIFLEGCYDLRLPGRWVAMDIGANVGFASLFFAAQPWIDHVVAFEPFPATQADHTRNIHANPRWAPKISLEPYGLSDRNGHAVVEYDAQWSGSMSVQGLGSWRTLPSTRRQSVSIELRLASEAVSRIRRDYPDRRVLAKIDCEGSEYPILRELASASKLSELDVIVMEWHGAKPDELVEILTTAGFALQVRPLSADENLGLIVAWSAQNA